MRVRAGSVGVFLMSAIVTLAACSASTPLDASIAIQPTAASSVSRDVEIGSPEIACPAAVASWRGIVPGQSTVADVIETLGEPARRGANTFVYPPIVPLSGGGSYGNRIFFRDDKVVDWIDAWVLDADGSFHTIAEFAQHYGATLDRVYVNGHFDMSGPDQVYVWSHCGIAVTAISERGVRRSEGEILPLTEVNGVDHLELIFRHPVHPRSSEQPRPNVRDIVGRKFLFQPTDFAFFDEFYADRIPYVHSQVYETRLTEECDAPCECGESDSITSP